MTMDPLEGLDPVGLRLVKYPDPALARACVPVRPDDPRLRELADRMFAIMHAARGVGLAAPQVGVSALLFVANPAGEPGADQAVYVNPEIVSQSGSVLMEEGCLSCPGVQCKIKRSAVVTIRAFDLSGGAFEQTGEELLGRVFQHETDHLAGRLILDRMSAVARLSNRRTIKDLEDEYSRGAGD